jgi:glucose/arabinose dehydrogenase
MRSNVQLSSIRWIPASVLCLLICAGQAFSASEEEGVVFRLPDGFKAEVLVEDVPNARSMALGDDDTLYIGTRRLGKVYAVKNVFSGQPEVSTLVENLQVPNGVAIRDGDLYVAEPQRVLRYADIGGRLDSPGEPQIVDGDLPYKGKLHSWRYIRFGPDDQLYVSIGAPGNAVDEPDLALMLRMAPDGSSREVFARGIRNSVGFDWHPETGELWFTDNGRDMLGDDVPPGELNRAPTSGLDFGYPYCHAGFVRDPEFGDLGECEKSAAPAQALGPHVAPLGMVFYTGDMFPAEYRNQVFIAEHGSWNRSKAAGKTGYRVTLVRLEGSEAVSYQPFMEGFLDDEQVLGRPVDLILAPDGALLVSDDQRGVVYRIYYSPR